ncbi:DUF3040 domain-containing protein [Streptomyces sp. NPDC058423]|uniref:DUF3040 domain-containing protein n=1 Tax=unclassified Streptomyces TaxID=2593676 RepID=UPI00365F1746
MTRPGDETLNDLDARMRLSDPRFARGLDAGHPGPPSEYRHWPACALLAAALALLVAGLALPQGLMLAAGLVLAGMAAQFLTAPRRPAGRRPRPRPR